MPSTMPGRELIKKYLKERSISIADLAKAYGLARQDVTDYLSGRNTSPKSNQFVLKVIKDLKIQKKIMEKKYVMPVRYKPLSKEEQKKMDKIFDAMFKEDDCHD